MNLWGVIKGLLVKETDDQTKQLSLEVDPTATTATRTTLKSAQTADRSLTLPDVDGELVEKDAAQTITNKNMESSTNTLTTASSDSFTRQSGNQQLLTLPDPSSPDTLVGESHTQTLTNKTIDGDNNTLQNIDLPSLKTQLADAGKFIIRDGSGNVVSGKDVPSGDVVGDTDTQTLQNKTIDATAATGNNTLSADAVDIVNDPAGSSLTSTDQQAANDEIAGRLDTVESNKLDGPGTHADNLLLKTDGVDTNNMQTTGVSVDDLNNITGVNDLTVGGDLTVNGTTTTINTANLDVEDSNITVNNNGNDASAEGAGLTVERTGTDGSLVYEDALTSKFKVGALGSEVEVMDVSSSQTVTNKDMSDPTNNVDTASADSLTRATGNQQVVTIPDTATPDNFVLEAQQQTLTNKDIDGGTATDNSRVTLPKGDTATLDALTRKEGTVLYNTELNTIVYDDGTQLNQITGTGGAGVNYVPNPDGEIGVDRYNAYDDASGSVPIDGTGGSPSSIVATPVILAADIVRGTKSIGLVKSAADAQGEGISIDLDPFDNIDKDSKIPVSFDYKVIGVTPENYASGDIKVYVYDVDNTTLLGVVNSEDGDLLYAESGKFVGEFYSTDSENYRLIFHVTSTNALSWAVAIDNVQVGPEGFIPATYDRQEIIDLAGQGDFTAGKIRVARSGGLVNITIIEALTYPSNSSPEAGGVIPEWARPTLRVQNLHRMTTVVSMSIVDPDGTYGFEFRDFSGSLFNSLTMVNGTTTYSVEDISNVVSNTQLNQQTLTSTAPIQNPTGAIASSFSNAAVFGIIAENDGNAYNTSTGQYTCPRDGRIAVYATLEFQYTPAASVTSGVEFRNVTTGGVTVRGHRITGSGIGQANPNCSGIMDVSKGDIIEIRSFCSGASPSYTTAFTGSQFSINYIPDYSTFGVVNPNSEVIRISGAPFVGRNFVAGVWQDIASFTLQPGTYDLDGTIFHSSHISVPPASHDVFVGIGTVAGNSSTGMSYTEGTQSVSTMLNQQFYDCKSTFNSTFVVNTPTTYYLKDQATITTTSDRLNRYILRFRRIK